MNITSQNTIKSLKLLITGIVNAHIESGKCFKVSGVKLSAYDIVDESFPLVCLLSQQLGEMLIDLDSPFFRFEDADQNERGVLNKLKMEVVRAPPFATFSPLIYYVFHQTIVLNCEQLEHVFLN